MATFAFSGPYSQDFDDLLFTPATGNAWTNGSTLEGWYLFRQPDVAVTTYTANSGGSNAGSFVSFGATDDEDRALGGVGSGGTYFGRPASGSIAGYLAFGAANATGDSISEFSISFTGEQWRNGGNVSAQSMVFEYGFGTDFTVVANWQPPGGLFDWASPVTGATAAAVDGNSAGQVTGLGGTISGVTWAPGDTLWLRWVERNDAGNDHGLAIDDFSLTLPASPGDVQITEYLYSGTAGEYVEFTNVGGSPVDFAGWSFDDDSRTPGAQDLSAFGIVQPGESVILTEADAVAFRAAWSLDDSVRVIGGLTQNLGRGDEINLFDETSTLVDRLTYGDQTFAGTPRTQNVSAWAPVDQLADQVIDGDWRLSAVNDAQNSRTAAGNDIGSPGLYNTGAAGVLVIETAGATALTEGGATDSYSVVLRQQPAADVSIAVDGGSQVSANGSPLVFTPANWNIPQTVTLTAVDDADFEGPHQGEVSHTVSSADASYNGIAVRTVNAAVTDDDVARPTANLSVSSNVASESAATSITVTVTLSEALPESQSVTLDVTGAGITAADYLLGSTTITIPANQTTGSTVFTLTDDATVEGVETATLTIANPSAGIALGSGVSQDIVITNNDGSFLTKVGAASSTTASEIPAFDAGSDRVYVVAASKLDVYSMGSTGALTPLGIITDPGFAVPAGTTAAPNSVAIKNGIVAVAYEVKDNTTGAHQPGKVSFFNAADGSFIKAIDVGYLPDMLTFTPDGSKVVVANEGEPNSYGQADSFDPVGSVSIIDLSGGVAAATVQDAGFAAFNSQIDSLRAAGVRIFGPGATVAQDLEPEYVTITPDGTTAVVTLQEANALAVVDLTTATVTAVQSLGTKDFSLPGQGFDASDRDLTGSTGTINIQNWPVQGMYMPDAIANFTVGGTTYFITANEGDSRDYDGFSEEVRVGSDSYVLDPTAFPNATDLKANANLGRLQLTNASGDTDGDGDFDQIMAFGARSFTIWDAAGTVVYDSGDDMEQITAARTPTLFNSDGLPSKFDSRSDNKGPEPEGVVTGVIGGRTYAFVGSERTGDVLVFDVSTPTAPQFVQYINTPEDRGVEGLSFVSATDSPTGKPLLITAYEVSNSVAVHEIAVPLRIADIQGASHLSPYAGQAVQAVPGIVTAVASNGFYIQDPLPDANPATSDGIFVFTGSAPTVQIGDALKVSGKVTEFRPGNNPDNLTTTEITSPVISVWADAPAGGIAPLVLGVDRIQPTTSINDDFSSPSGNVETGGDFDPANEGIDFYESLEGMLVQVQSPVATSPTNGFGEIFVLPNGGADATSLTARGGSLITEDDFNPERLQIDNLLNSQVFPVVDVGTTLNDVTGVIAYNFSNYELLALQTPTVATPSPLEREVTPLTGSDDQLTVATFNVENLDPNDGSAKFNALATAIVDNLRAPDILNLEEVQDNNGATNNGTVDADVTLQTLIAAIAAAGGPAYAYQQLNPVNNQDGGEPGGNIRVAFLYNPDRVDFVDGSLLRLSDGNLADGDAFASSRKPLVGRFVFNGEEVTVVGNHFNSKGGDDPLFGPTQPPVRSSEVQRNAQAEIVSAYVEGLLASDPQAKVIVAGDLNDFEFSSPLTRLEDAGLASLIETLPANERYTYNFQGNAQALDHLMASGSLMSVLDGYDVVHINSEFAVQVSDHDPVVARFNIPGDQVLTGGTGRDTLMGDVGDDVITGGGGRDLIATGAGADTLVYTSMLDFFDVVLDFQPGQDHLDLTALLAAVGYQGNDPVGDGYLSVLPLSVNVPNGPTLAVRTTVLFDADGQAGSELPRPMVILVGVAVDDATSLLPTPVFEV